MVKLLKYQAKVNLKYNTTLKHEKFLSYNVFQLILFVRFKNKYRLMC